MSSASIHAQNYLKILGLIDRTIIPRRLVLSNGPAKLTLLAARQCASLEDAASDTARAPDALASAIAQICGREQRITHHVEPLDGPRPAFAGFPAIAIVNAQGEGATAGGNPKTYRFSKNGWPMSTPANASFASLSAAARIAWAMTGWQGLHGGKLTPPTLVLAISDALPDDLSVSVEGEVTITSTPPSSLGRLVANWRNRPGAGSPNG